MGQQREYETLIDALAQCTAIILVFPFGPAADAGRWEPFLFGLMHSLARVEDVKIKRIILAFNQYESVVLAEGNKAAYYAAQKENARKALEDAVCNARGLVGALAKLLNRGGDKRIDIYCVPTSFYGFVRYNGCANVSSRGEKANVSLLGELIGKGEILKDEVSHRSLWVPFLTCDPFIAAVTGQWGELFFPLQELAPWFAEAGSTEEEIEPPPAEIWPDETNDDIEPPPPPRKWWKFW
jgi:hypothetical protein